MKLDKEEVLTKIGTFAEETKKITLNISNKTKEVVLIPKIKLI